ncbi:GGDEF domain-containing protein [bacterium]|nr:GGDEF domain-containing protein [bacterium]
MKKVIPFHSKPDTNAVASTSIRESLPTGEALADRPSGWNGGAEQLLSLMHRLIGCNDAEALISLFFQWCSDLGLCDGMTYVATDKRADLNLGNRRHHSAKYALTLDQMDLGHITICRKERFNEDELLSVEQALGTLARCLRSAIEFQILQEMVTQDTLTGLGNRLSLHEWIGRELSRTRRQNSPLALMMIDVDHFKKLNDELGHLGGDHVLKTIANVFKRSTRASDLLFRFGGDEFTILLPHTDLQGACDAGRQIRNNIARISDDEYGLGDAAKGLRPDVSIGIAVYQPGDTQDSLLQRADTRLYHAKAQGRGAICSDV